jgi:hypothetical protein
LEQDYGINLLDKNHVWKARQDTAISQSAHDLNIMFKTKKSEETLETVLLETQWNNLTKGPLLLSLEYASKSPNSHSKYFIEIMATDKNTRYFKHDLIYTQVDSTSNFFILPPEIDEKPLKFRLGINANSSGQQEFALKSAKIISYISN